MIIGKKFYIGTPVLISLAIIIILCVGIVKAVSSLNFSVFLEMAGDELQTDIHGNTNFLLLGSGGKNHEGSNLTDTMMLASLNKKNKLLTIISIPRDLYVKNDLIADSKINEVYFNAKTYYGSVEKGLQYTGDKVGEIFGVSVQYLVNINFDGFMQLIDALGGIDVDVKTPIYDPYYPKDGTYEYETFSIDVGPHHMDGELALKYARSRETTSDFDRSQRQQQIIYAIKEKALQGKILLDQGKITEILETIKANIETNIKVKEILTLGAMAKDFSQENITHRLVHDDPTKCGGLLYTPVREAYGGQFVLIPAGGDKFLQMYADLNFNYPQISHATTKIHVLNGTKSPGVAGETKQVLQRFCFEINRFGNAGQRDLAQTTYYYAQKYDKNNKPIDSRPISLDFLQKIIPGKESTEIPPDYQEYIIGTDIILEIGADYVSSPTYLKDPFYYLPPIMVPTTTETTTANVQ